MRSNIRNTTYGLAGWACSTRSLLCAAVLVSILAGMSPAQDGILPLVPADDELAAFLDKARQRIEEKDYENAITYLNALIQRTDAGFYRVKKTRRYLPIRHGATELLGTMPDEGLEQYRKLYDPQAYQLYLEARQAGDLGLLRQVADRYANTSYGPVALETLAEMSFDRGMYTQATWFWQQVRDKTDPSDNPLMLAKLAVAAHLSGQDKLFGEVRKDLAARHPDASARVGRTQRNLVEFVDWAGKNLTVEVAKAGRASAGWPGLWSMPGQIGLMDDADVVLIPRWSTASDDMVGKDDAGEYLVALSAEIKKADTTRRSNSSTEVKLEQGHVLLESRQGNRRETGILPAMIHPIVVGEWVIHRNDRRIVAHDAYTGEKAWESIEFPLVRDMPTNSSGRHYYSYYYGRDVMDTGRYSLSVGGDKVYALGYFRPWLGRVYRQPNTSDFEDNSSLWAISLDREGSVEWCVGRDIQGNDPQGNDELLRGGKFLTVPTYSEGSLFLVIKYMESYWLACLDSDNGELLWKTRMAQTPPMGRNRGAYNRDYMLDMATPPAVANGRVYTVNNAGVIACFDQRSGQPVWAYQYDSSLTNSPRGYSYVTKPDSGVNPIIVHQGRVMALPVDSPSVICLSAEDGGHLWSAGRRGLAHLTGIDESRVLLSGTYKRDEPSLAVLSTRDGSVLAAPREARGIHGRPAVTPEVVIASGMGELVRVNLKGYNVSLIGPAEPNALLGNLVSVGGKLFAANAFGVSAYMGYDVTRQRLGDRLAQADNDAQRFALLVSMGELAFAARRFDQALADFSQAMDFVGKVPSAPRNEAEDLLRRTHIALGNLAGDLDVMKEHFAKAQGLSDTPAEKAHMLIRMVKFHERASRRRKDPEQLVQAVELATQLIAEYPDVKLAKVEIGDQPDPTGRLRKEDLITSGRLVGDELIQHMIDTYGPECYAAFDVKAGKMLEEARRTGDVEQIVKVSRAYKHSKYRDDALFAAAEHYYLEAEKAKGQAAQNALNQAVKYFSQVHSDTRSDLRASATVALAAIYAKGGKPIAARLTLEQVRSLPQETAIRYGNVRGKLGELIEMIDNNKVPEGSPALELKQSLQLPLKERFRIDGEVHLVKDSDGHAVRIGQSVLVLKGNRAMLVNTTADSFEQSQDWVGLASVDPQIIERYSYFGPTRSLTGGVSRDGQAIFIADRTGVTGFDASTAKRKYHIEFKDERISTTTFPGMRFGADRLVVGDSAKRLHCYRISDGKKLWTTELRESLNKKNLGAPQVVTEDAVVAAAGRQGGLVILEAETGKIRQSIGGTFCQAWAAGEGKFLTIAGGKLSMWNAKELSKPLWSKQFNANNYASVIGQYGDNIFVSQPRRDGKIDVISAATGEQVRQLPATRVDGKQVLPIQLGVLEDGSYVISGTAGIRGNFGQAYDAYTPCSDLILVGLDTQGKKRWGLLIDETQGGYNLPLPMQLGQRYVAFSALSSHRTHVQMVVDSHSGQVEWKKITDSSTDPGNSSFRQRVRGLSAPAMTSGHLVAGDRKGLSVYGSD